MKYDMSDVKEVTSAVKLLDYRMRKRSFLVNVYK